MYFSKNVFLHTFEWKTAFSVIYKQKSAWKHLFFAISYILGSMGAYLTPSTPSSTTPSLGTLPANSQHTKQFLSHPGGL